MTRLPKIKHTRSTLVCYVNEYEDGALSLFVSADTYPKLLRILCPTIVEKSPTGWKESKSGKMKYLWFPPDKLDDEDLAEIEDWREHFGTYVLLGITPHLSEHFTDELDYCMALDFNYLPAEGRRTFFGEAEYQLKYQDSVVHFGALSSALVEALNYLPLDEASRESIVITWVPADPDKSSLPRKLARSVSRKADLDLLEADLLTDKRSLKGLPVEKKIPEWKRIYSEPDSVELLGDVDGRTIVVVDDLYQSGATLWSFATFLKDQGARHVIGLPCVKSLRDSDNQ